MLQLPVFCPRMENDGAAAAALARMPSALDVPAIMPTDESCSTLRGLAVGDEGDSVGRHSSL